MEWRGDISSHSRLSHLNVLYKTLGLSITRIEALGWKIAKRAAGEENIRVHRQIHGHVYGCKDDVTLILYDPDSNEHVLPQYYQLSRYLARSRTHSSISTPSKVQYIPNGYLIGVYHVTRTLVLNPD
jgi:hypothetical protein